MLHKRYYREMKNRSIAIAKLIDIIKNPTARVKMCGQFPEDKSTIMNFEQISEGQDLYSKDDLIRAFNKGKKEGEGKYLFKIGEKSKGKSAQRVEELKKEQLWEIYKEYRAEKDE